MFHKECHDISAFSAAEILPNLLYGGNHKTGGSLICERTEPLEIGPGFLQLHKVANNLLNAGGFKYLIYGVPGYQGVGLGKIKSKKSAGHPKGITRANICMPRFSYFWEHDGSLSDVHIILRNPYRQKERGPDTRGLLPLLRTDRVSSSHRRASFCPPVLDPGISPEAYGVRLLRALQKGL